MAAKTNKHLLPKCKLNILQTKLAYEAEMIYRKQMASLKPLQMFPKVQDNDDDDLQDFNLNHTTAKPKCLPALITNRNSVLPSNPTFLNIKRAKSIKPLANSTRIFNTQSTNTSECTDTTFNNAVVDHLINTLSSQMTNAQTNIIQKNNTLNTIVIPDTTLITTANSPQNAIPIPILQPQTLNISKIPLPTSTQPTINNHIQHVTSDIAIFNSQETENISFYTSFYIQPPIQTIATQNQNNNHIHHYTPPMSPINQLPQVKPMQTTFPLRRLEQNKEDDNTTPICRKCGANINFNMLLNIANRMPTGRQIMCAPCLLMISSKSKDRNVDYFTHYNNSACANIWYVFIHYSIFTLLVNKTSYLLYYIQHFEIITAIQIF